MRVVAQTLSAGERVKLETEKDQLFQQMYRDPANLDVTFAYADISARLGDYEAAVSALERMLLFNPNLPRVQLELGALYFRMVCLESCPDLFRQGRAIPAQPPPPPEVRARVAEYLAQIETLPSRDHFSGYLFLGGQHQTDANVAGSSGDPDTGLRDFGAAQHPFHQTGLGQRIRQRFGHLQL